MDGYLIVGAGVGDNQQTRLDEPVVDLIGKGTGAKATRDEVGTRVVGELVARALAVRAARHDGDVRRVLNGDDDARSQHQLLPRLAQVQQVNGWKGGAETENTEQQTSRTSIQRRARGDT